MALITVAWFYRPEGQQINFQEFKYELLEPRLVDHIVVSINKSIARIYVTNTPCNQTDSEVVEGTLPAKGTGGQYKFYFNIGSVKSFEEKLKAAQEELGLEPHDYVPVTYSFEEDWEQELMSVTSVNHKGEILRTQVTQSNGSSSLFGSASSWMKGESESKVDGKCNCGMDVVLLEFGTATNSGRWVISCPQWKVRTRQRIANTLYELKENG
ncbi:hypothetical protein AHAS_Ahas04G0242900 [Arachis hypogaea]